MKRQSVKDQHRENEKNARHQSSVKKYIAQEHRGIRRALRFHILVSRSKSHRLANARKILERESQ